jgi:argininosuccinate lyase
MARGDSLRRLPLAEYQAVSPLFAPDVLAWLDFERAVERRSSVGGTARQAVENQLAEAEQLLKPEEEVTADHADSDCGE